MTTKTEGNFDLEEMDDRGRRDSWLFTFLGVHTIFYFGEANRRR